MKKIIFVSIILILIISVNINAKENKLICYYPDSLELTEASFIKENKLKGEIIVKGKDSGNYRILLLKVKLDPGLFGISEEEINEIIFKSRDIDHLELELRTD